MSHNLIQFPHKMGSVFAIYVPQPLCHEWVFLLIDGTPATLIISVKEAVHFPARFFQRILTLPEWTVDRRKMLLLFGSFI
jgi:hypothetical protein